MRVAIGTSSGEYVDEHFGHARYFEIYEVNRDGFEFIGARKAPASCRGHCEGGFETVLELLQDCDAIFVVRIGETAAAFLISHGKRVFEADGTVENLLQEIQVSNLVED